MNKLSGISFLMVALAISTLGTPGEIKAAPSWAEWFWSNKKVAMITAGVVGVAVGGYFWWYGKGKKPGGSDKHSSLTIKKETPTLQETLLPFLKNLKDSNISAQEALKKYEKNL